jgi:hypothetical protein
MNDIPLKLKKSLDLLISDRYLQVYLDKDIIQEPKLRGKDD